MARLSPLLTLSLTTRSRNGPAASVAPEMRFFTINWGLGGYDKRHGKTRTKYSPRFNGIF